MDRGLQIAVQITIPSYLLLPLAGDGAHFRSATELLT